VAYWWVNHKQTRDHEVRGDYLWSPRQNRNGARNSTYDNMRKATPGDIVFSYANGLIGAVGVVMAPASPCPKPPEFGTVGDYWSADGWLLPVEFKSLDRPVKPKQYLPLIAPLLPQRISPIRLDGNGNQGVYLTSISDVLGRVLEDLVGVEINTAIHAETAMPSAMEIAEIQRIESDLSLRETQRSQLVQARVGQGLFRALVLSSQQTCRVTGVSDHRVLRASHIKPWRLSSNDERLDPDNGLLLSPHVDALFDQELISFEEDGRIVVRKDLSIDVLERWRIDPRTEVGRFRPRQAAYLELHRASLHRR
jgi:putative restriction endonuclease